MFCVGEIAIANNWVPYAHYNDQEVLVVGGYEPRHSVDILTREPGIWSSYEVRTADGCTFLVAPNELRKRQPPRESTTTWENVSVWRPRETEAIA